MGSSPYECIKHGHFPVEGNIGTIIGNMSETVKRFLGYYYSHIGSEVTYGVSTGTELVIWNDLERRNSRYFT